MNIKKNTYRSGRLHFYFFKSKRKGYIGACLELCIVEEGRDLELVRLKTLAAAKEYLMMVCSKKLGQHLLNQELPEEIIEEFVESVRRTKLKGCEEKEYKLEDVKNKSEKDLIKCKI